MSAPRFRGRFVSVGTKLALATSLVVLLVTAVLYAQLTRHEKERIVSAKERAAQMVVDLFAESVAAPLEFDDPQAVSEELRHLGANREVLGASVWRAGRERPEGEIGARTASDGAPNPRALAAPILEERKDEIRLAQPVRGALGQPIGYVAVDFSLAAENATFEASKERILFGLIGLGLGLVLTLVAISRRTIVAPLDRLVAAAKRVEEGATTAEVAVGANDEVGRLGTAFNVMAAAIGDRERRVAAALQALEAKDAIITEDLEQARRFQQKLLPAIPPVGRVRFAVLYQPTGRVGGDIYDIFELRPGAYRIFLADTTGHGVQASLRTMVLRTEYDSLKRSPDGPARVLERLNEKLTASYPDLELRCSALCLDVIAQPDGSFLLAYANAAHPPFLHASRNGTEEHYERGPFLGVFDQIELVTRELRLEAGDRILAFTDALYEQESPEGVPFGDGPAAESLGDLRVGLDGVIHRLETLVADFASKPHLDDDLTIVGIECGEAREEPLEPSPPSEETAHEVR